MAQIYMSPTAQAAQTLLSGYLIDRQNITNADKLQSVVLSDMPKNKTTDNAQERKLVATIDAQKRCDAIDAAVKQLVKKPRTLIQYFYLASHNDPIGEWNKVAPTIELDPYSSTWHNYLAVSLEAFAEVYDGGSLIQTANVNW